MLPPLALYSRWHRAFMLLIIFCTTPFGKDNAVFRDLDRNSSRVSTLSFLKASSCFCLWKALEFGQDPASELGQQ
jgi:hypothetical protein